jgi:hypothetical protein
MKKKTGERSHANEVRKAHGDMTPEQIRQAKCSRRRNAHLAIKEANKAANANQAKLSKKEGYALNQLVKLDRRLGMGIGASAERKRLIERFAKEMKS